MKWPCLGVCVELIMFYIDVNLPDSFSPGYLKWRHKDLGECLKFYLPLQYFIFFFLEFAHQNTFLHGSTHTRKILETTHTDSCLWVWGTTWKNKKKKEPYSISTGRVIRINSNKPIRKRTLPSYVMSVFAQKFKLIWEQNNLFRLCTFNRVLQSSPTPHDQFSLTGHTRI